MSNNKLPSLKNLKPSPTLKLTPSAAPKQKTLVPPVLHQVGKLAAGVAAVNAGSATGNPRNKCALQPGHSLMDWIRLGSSGKDLTGVGSRAGHVTVTLRQLAEHDKETDAWLAIRGKVYNITNYIPFHPGGPEEIIKGAGKDATTLFDQVHPWVNYDQILNKCLVGRLVLVDPDIDTENLFTGNDKSPTIPNNTFKSPEANTPDNTLTSDKDQQALENNTAGNEEHSKTNATETVMLPRFDWIQKTDSITIIFYTKAFANPQVEINPPNQENIINIFLVYDSTSFTNELKFSNSIQWPCQVKINYETGKLEVVFKKKESKIWENYGVLKQRSDGSMAMDLKLKYSVINKIQVNHNTCLLELERVDSTKLTIPLGKHVRVFGKIKGEEISRSYTPVPCSLLSKYKPQVYTTDNVCLMVKTYPNGNISKFICNKNKYDVVELSKALGTFNLKDLESKEIFLLLAAGTGITPMLGLLLFLLERRIRKCQGVSLLFFNRTEEDIIFKNKLDLLQKEEKRFKVEYILSQASSKWKGLTGHISSKILQDTLKMYLENSETAYTKKDVYVAICGPTVFTTLAQSLLRELEVEDDQMYSFLG